MRLEEKIVHSIISSTITLHYNEQLKHTPLYNKQLKHFGNCFNKELIKIERSYDEVEKHEENSLNDVYNVFYDFINEVKPVHIQELGELTAIIQAYRKDSKSILGITKKILN